MTTLNSQFRRAAQKPKTHQNQGSSGVSETKTTGSAAKTAKAGSPLQFAKDVIEYDSPRFGTVDMTQKPTQMDQLTGQVVDSLSPSMLSFLGNGTVDGSKAHAKLMPMDNQKFSLMMRRLTFKDGGKHLNSYVNGLAAKDPAKLTEFAGKLAQTGDTFGASMMRENMSPEAWKNLQSARNNLDADGQAKFDKAMGTPEQIQTTLDQRASFNELYKHLNRDLKDSSPLVITDSEALAANDLLMGSKHFDSDVQRMAKKDEGVYLSRFVEELDEADPSKIGDFARKLSHLDPSVSGDTVRNALSHKALSALMRDLDPKEQAALKQRLGGAEVVDQRLDLKANQQALKDAGMQVVGETLEVGATGGEWTKADQAWLKDVEGVMVSQDDQALRTKLDKAGPKRFWKLWQEVPGIWERHPEIKPDESQYLNTMHTKDGEAWDVRWNNSSSDDVKQIENLSATLGAEAGSKLRKSLEYRKEFPVLDGEAGVLEGGSTFGFNGWENAEVGGTWTPNSLEMGSYSGQPAVIMNYKENDHFNSATNTGYLDVFLPITKNTVLALGGQGLYGEGNVAQDKNLVFYMQRAEIDNGNIITD